VTRAKCRLFGAFDRLLNEVFHAGSLIRGWKKELEADAAFASAFPSPGDPALDSKRSDPQAEPQGEIDDVAFDRKVAVGDSDKQSSWGDVLSHPLGTAVLPVQGHAQLDGYAVVHAHGLKWKLIAQEAHQALARGGFRGVEFEAVFGLCLSITGESRPRHAAVNSKNTAGILDADGEMNRSSDFERRPPAHGEAPQAARREISREHRRAVGKLQFELVQDGYDSYHGGSENAVPWPRAAHRSCFVPVPLARQQRTARQKLIRYPRARPTPRRFPSIVLSEAGALTYPAYVYSSCRANLPASA
jgi:hypothetical protein